MLSGKKVFDDKIFKNLLEICINFSFRYITIAGFNNKVLEGDYSELARKVRQKEITKISEVIDALKKNYVDDETFLSLFDRKEFKMNNQIPKYILKKIENHLDPTSDKEKVSKIITLEHILPKNPDKTWLEYLEKKNLDKDDLIYKLGNMTLLTKKMNAEMHNEFYRECNQFC